MSKLTFVTVTDETGRNSSLGLYDRRAPDEITIVGGLSHGVRITPATEEDADRLIQWLIEWKSKHGAESRKETSASH